MSEGTLIWQIIYFFLLDESGRLLLDMYPRVVSRGVSLVLGAVLGLGFVVHLRLETVDGLRRHACAENEDAHPACSVCFRTRRTHTPLRSDLFRGCRLESMRRNQP